MPLNYTSVSRVLRTLPMIGSITTITSASIYETAVDAEAVVDAKLSKLYSVPVVGSPPLLAMVATHVCIYHMLSLRIMVTDQANSKTKWPDKYKESMALLDEVAAGKVQLVDSSGSVITAGVAAGSAAAPWSNTKDYTPTFGEDSFEGSTQDPDKVDSWIDSRD